MKFRKLLLLAAMLAGVWETSLAEDVRRDGNWWLNLSDQAQVLYTAGLLDGTELGNAFAAYGCHDESLKKYMEPEVCSYDASSKYSAGYNKLLANRGNTQLIEGMKVFYADYKNRSILTDKAMFAVLRSIIGDPTIETFIDNLRKNN